MKRKKSLLCLLLAAAVCFGALAGCGAGTAGQSEREQVTLIVKVPPLPMSLDGYEDIDSAQAWLEQAGAAFAAQYQDADVTVEVKLFDYLDEQEAITGSFDTDMATDVLYENFFNMASYIHTGRVVPLDDIISDEARADLNGALWAVGQMDGKTYMYPYLYMQNVLIYNRALLEQCGLEQYLGEGTAIQNWTIEEWETILDTLAEQLPGGIYPMVMYAKNNQGDTHIMSLLRMFGSTIFDKDGNFDLESPEAIQALAWIQQGADRGWYAPNPENLEISDCQELFANNQMVFYIYNIANQGLYDDVSRYGFVNLPGGTATIFATGFEVFDNGDPQKVQAAKAFVQYIYDTDQWLELSACDIPASNRVLEKYADQIPMLSDFAANNDHVVDFMNNSPNWQGTDTSVRSVFYPHIQDLLLERVTPEECAAALNADLNRALEIGRESSQLHE
jgi:multiple sugar transport system substrate-binding protein